VLDWIFVNVKGTDLHLYNVHLETMMMKQRKRDEQLQAILDHSKSIPADDPIIVAGDFNSFFPKDRKLFTRLFNENGFQWYSEELTYTARALKGILKNKIDHVYGTGISIHTIAVSTHVKASDHYPVYFNIHFNQ